MKKKKQKFELDFYGRKIIVEHGELAKQATGSVLVSCINCYCSK